MCQADAQLYAAEQLGAEVITCFDECYPANLAESEHSPLVLFVRGRLDISDRDAVAVVGTRQASLDGERRARQLARILAESGITVVSGLARGIDTAAHTATLDAGGRTIAVVGCGLDRTYPSENAALADRIAETGAVVSQFPIGTPPGKRNFPMRNKTMAHLSRATVVIEAGEQSGAKMQADFALNHQDPQRHVFLTRSLVDAQPADGWASRFIARGARVLAREGDLLSLFPGKRPPSPQQLGFGF